jgi:flagellar basal body-associated protein FliL
MSIIFIIALTVVAVLALVCAAAVMFSKRNQQLNDMINRVNSERERKLH